MNIDKAILMVSNSVSIDVIVIALTALYSKGHTNNR